MQYRASYTSCEDENLLNSVDVHVPLYMIWLNNSADIPVYAGTSILRHPKQCRKPYVWSDRAQLRRKILDGIHIQWSFQLIEELFVHLNMEVQSFGPPTGIIFVSSSCNSLFETGGFKVLVILLMYSRMLTGNNISTSVVLSSLLYS